MPEAFEKVKNAVLSRVKRDIVGKDEVIDLALITLLAGGHMLIDDVPGTGKTLLAKSFASALSLSFGRIQCVPDLLPSDITGINFFDMKLSEFRFVPGPVFVNLLLADELNRAMPKTQAGLLECMEEGQVTIDGTTHPLPTPFMVIATQNPVETRGTFELPEAQLDRFMVKVSMGYPTHDESIEIIERKLAYGDFESRALPADTGSESDISIDDITAAAAELRATYICRDLIGYAASICEETRQAGGVTLGAGPRALVHLIRVAQGHAAFAGRDYVLPDDIKKAAIPTLSHRLLFSNSFLRTREQGSETVGRILATLPVPSEQIDFSRRG